MRKVAVIFDWLDNIDRRIIYIFVAVSLAIPLILGTTLPPAEMSTSQAFYNAINKIEPRTKNKLVLIAADWGPNTLAENLPQTSSSIEHLMRRRIPFAIISLYSLSTPFLDSIPRDVAAKLNAEMPEERWIYGKDWINVGYRPGWGPMIQGLAKSDDWHKSWETDAYGTPVEDLPVMNNIRSIRDVPLLLQFTGLVGTFNTWIQFFQVEGHRPDMLHGCTSISIPEARIYFSSGQIVGLHEGVAGAAYYEKLLTDEYSLRTPGLASRINTGLAFAQLVIIGFIILGNIGYGYKKLYGMA